MYYNISKITNKILLSKMLAYFKMLYVLPKASMASRRITRICIIERYI